MTDSKNDADAGLKRDSKSLQNFLFRTPWWVSRHYSHVVWDGQSAFISKLAPELADSAGDCGPQVESNAIPVRPHHQSVRSLRKKDLYAAWNAMMQTPRFVHQKFHHHRIGERSTSPVREVVSTNAPYLEETTGETIVWRQFMDQVCDVTYRADSKRLGGVGCPVSDRLCTGSSPEARRPRVRS